MFRGYLKSRYLFEFEKVRDNNFTILRFFLAFAVLFGHSFPISGNGSDPITMLILPHAWIGSIAVGGFFAVSGFLVSASISNRSVSDFAISRILRLYPAVIVYSLAAILIIGPIASGVPLSQYFQQNPWVNMWNATLWEWNYNLPYGFPGRPFSGATNGSTWTLPVELRCYVALFILGLLGVFRSKDAPINLSCSRGKLQFSRHLQRHWTKSDRKIMYGELFRPVLRVKREPHPYP